MKHRLIVSMVGVLTAVGLVSPVWGFEISRSRTRAEILMDASGAPVIHLAFRAELINNPPDPCHPPDPCRDVAIGWEVGGIEPCIKVLIPAGCFVTRRDGFRVVDFRGCGVQMTFGSNASDPMPLFIMDFEARFEPRAGGTAILGVETNFQPLDPVQPPTILGALGGAAVQIMIGTEMAVAPPRGVETVAGVDPEPF
jgi:hypothetical protein